MYCRFSSKLSHSEIQKRLAESQLIPIDPNWESTILMPDDDDHHDYWAEGMLEETMGGFVVTLPVRPAEGNLWVRDEDVSEQFRLSRIRRTSEWRDAWRLAIRLNVRLCGGLVHQLDVEEESRNDLEYVFREVRRIADRFGFDFASPPEWVSASPKPDEESEERSLGDLLVPAWIADLNERPPITVELVDEMYRDLNFLYCGYELYRRVRRGSFTDDVRELRDGGAFIPVGHFKLSTHELPRRCEFQTDADGKPARLKCRNCGWEVRSLLLAGWNSTAGVYRACGASERSPHLVEGFKNSAEYRASGSIEVDPPPPLEPLTEQPIGTLLKWLEQRRGKPWGSDWRALIVIDAKHNPRPGTTDDAIVLTRYRQGAGRATDGRPKELDVKDLQKARRDLRAAVKSHLGE